MRWLNLLPLVVRHDTGNCIFWKGINRFMVYYQAYGVLSSAQFYLVYDVPSMMIRAGSYRANNYMT